MMSNKIRTNMSSLSPKQNYTSNEEEEYKAKVNKQDPRYYNIKINFNYTLEQCKMQIVSEIGRGGYGVVYKAIDIDPTIPDTYAIKINFQTVAKELIYSQVAFLRICKDKRCLPRLVNLFDYQNRTHIITQYFDHDPFIKLLEEFKADDVRHYLFQLLLGLKSLKEVGIFHRDIKPNNFLYSRSKKTGVIIDFGLAEIDPFHETVLRKQREGMASRKQDVRLIDQKIMMYQRLRECLKIIGKHKIGTESYMPIQSIMHHSHQNYQSDIWPVGVIFLQFVLKKYNVFNHIKNNKKINGVKNEFFIYYLLELGIFFGSEAVLEQAYKLGYVVKLPKDVAMIDLKVVTVLQGFDQAGHNLLFRMLQLDVAQRITVEQALEHRFFDSVRKQHLLKKK